MKASKKKVVSEYDLGFENSIAYENMLSKVVMSLFGINRLNRMCEDFADHDFSKFPQELLQKLNLEITLHDRIGQVVDKKLIDKIQQGTIVVVNLPHGLVDLLGVVSLVNDNPRAKILINNPLLNMPQISDFSLLVKPSSGFVAAREAVRYLTEGGILIVFPAPRVAAPRKLFSRVKEKEWSPMFAKLARIANAPVVPLFISGRNSYRYLLADYFSPRLSNYMAVNQLLRMKNKQLRIVQGDPILPLSKRFENPKLSLIVRKVLFLLREWLYDPEDQQQLTNAITLSTGVQNQKLLLENIKLQELKDDPSFEMLDNGVVLTTPDRFNEKTKRRVTIFDQDRAIFDAHLIRVDSKQTDLMYSKFMLNRDFDIQHKKISKLLDQGAELSQVSALADHNDLIWQGLTQLAKHLEVKYLWTITLAEYLRSGLLLSETLAYLESTSQESPSKVFSKGVIARDGKFRIKRHLNNATLELKNIESVKEFGRIVGESLTGDSSSVIKIDPFTQVMYENSAAAIKFSRLNPQNNSAAKERESLSIVTLLELSDSDRES